MFTQSKVEEHQRAYSRPLALAHLGEPPCQVLEALVQRAGVLPLVGQAVQAAPSTFADWQVPTILEILRRLTGRSAVPELFVAEGIVVQVHEVGDLVVARTTDGRELEEVQGKLPLLAARRPVFDDSRTLQFVARVSELQGEGELVAAN